MKQIANKIDKIAKIVVCLVACVLFTLFCVGCETVTKGIVVNKQYRAAYTSVQYHLIGKTMVPFPVNHPERWTIRIRGYAETEDGKIDDSKEEYETYKVSETVYDHYDLGDEFDARKEHCDIVY